MQYLFPKQCGIPPVLSKSDALLEDLADKLGKNGFSISRRIETEPFALDIVAARNIFGISKGRMSTFIVVTSMETVKQETFLDFSARATRYLMDNGAIFLTEELGNRLLVCPTVVSRNVDQDMKDWLAKAIFKKHLDVFEFPVIVSADERTTHYSRETPVWGGAMFKGVRKFVQENLGTKNVPNQ